MDVRVSAGISPDAAAEMVADDGNTNSPLAFSMRAHGIFCAKAYSEPTYPMAFLVWEITPATPGLPFAACPAGKLTDLPAPYLPAHMELTLVR